MNLRRIESWKRIFGSDEERFAVVVKVYCSQAEFNSLNEKGVKDFLEGLK